MLTFEVFIAPQHEQNKENICNDEKHLNSTTIHFKMGTDSSLRPGFKMGTWVVLPSLDFTNFYIF